MTQAKVWKMREYSVYFPFFILHDWGKRSAEARSSHYAVLPKVLETLCTKNRPQGISSSRPTQKINFAFYGLNCFASRQFGLLPLASLKRNINNFVYKILRGLFLFLSLSKKQGLSDFLLPKCCRESITLRRAVPAEWRFPRNCSGSYCGTLPQSLPVCAVQGKYAH